MRNIICLCTDIDEEEVNKALNEGIHPSDIHAFYKKRVDCGSCLDKMHLMNMKRKQLLKTNEL
jgi:bacterioferritin-associated ferredoxin